MDRILVTGGGGFIGSHLARYLFQQGNYVRIVDIKFDDYIQEKYYTEKLTLDLRIWENCLKATKNIDKVYNLAANMGGIGFITTVGAEVMHDNVIINANMLEATRQNGVKRFLVSSSACVYPTYRQTDPNIKGLKEEDAYPADPDNFYGWEKLHRKNVRSIPTRPQHGNSHIKIPQRLRTRRNLQRRKRKSPAALCRKVAEATNPGTLEIWGDGKQTRSYCYVDDAVKATTLLMESNYNKPINISSDRLVTINALADIVIKISGKKITKKATQQHPKA